MLSDYVAVPKHIQETNKHVSLAADVFFINKNPFLATISENIKLTTGKYLPNRRIQELLLGMKEAKALYTGSGFDVKTALMDGEFKPMRYDLLEMRVKLNITAANEHSPIIERHIRVIKEQMRAIRHTLPFKVIPLTMLIEMTYFSIFWINAFPPKSGVSATISPRKIITGQQLDYKKHC